MEIVNALRELWRLRLAVLAACAVAAMVAVLTVYRVELSPPSLSEKNLEYAVASTQILIDSEVSSLPRTDVLLEPLTVRAAVFANFMTSTPVQAEIARVAGVPLASLTVTAPIAAQPDADDRLNQIVAEGRLYRLSLSAQQDLPILSVSAVAPTRDGARRLADASFTALRSQLSLIAQPSNIKPTTRVRVEQLGRADGSIVNEGVSKAMAALAFLGALLAGCVLILLASRLRREWQRSEGEGWPDLPLEEEHPAEPASVGSNGDRE